PILAGLLKQDFLEETLDRPDGGYVYAPQRGEPHEGFAPGTPWSAIPDDWACPDCVVREKLDFVTEPAS
ncbi:MAG: rubredoxin, partial [Proteobacteria bacterium]|nr:rubredoxin [Pseudomonadota bacterium]